MIVTQARVALVPMLPADIPQVVEIDHLSFPLPWPARAYQYELNENSASHFVVALRTEDTKPSPSAGWLRWPKSAPRHVIGYAGFWHVVDESHISTIAVHPDYRGQGVGEQLLAATLLRAIELGAAQATLEVRQSNTVAQHLYRKYGFEVFSTRPGYYRDNGEDALVMTAYRLDAPGLRERLRRVGVVIGDW